MQARRKSSFEGINRRRVNGRFCPIRAISSDSIQKALEHAVVASFTVEDFSPGGLRQTTKEDVEKRAAEFCAMRI
ncbi:MAG: hypothetical protein IKX88_02130 [Thermoguttaceae bacterium]|nr:hypothetical protein [Thermoguttaceae bacterium]